MPPDQPDFFETSDADPPAPPTAGTVDVPIEESPAEPAAPPAKPARKSRRRAATPTPANGVAPEPETAPAPPWHGQLAHVPLSAPPSEPEPPMPVPELAPLAPEPTAPSAVQQVLQAGRETRLAAWPQAPPTHAPASFAVLIPNWNGAAFIERCLASVLAALRQAGLSGAPILVHDDASDDDSVARITASFPQVQVIRSETNVGFGESVNRLMRACTAEWVYLLNNDLALATDFCARLRQTLDAYLAAPAAAGPRPLARPLVRVNRTAPATVIAARTAAAAPLYAIGAQTCDWATHEPNHGGQHVAWRDGLLAQEPFESDEAAPAGFFQAGACLIHRARFLQLGGFPALFHPGYWEDYDSAWAARASGWAVLYEPRAIAYHCGKGSMRRRYGAFGVSLMLKRNHLLFNWVNLHDGDLLARHLLALPRLVWRGADGPGEAGWGRALLAALQRLPDVLRLRADRRRRALLAERDLLGAGENMAASATPRD